MGWLSKFFGTPHRSNPKPKSVPTPIPIEYDGPEGPMLIVEDVNPIGMSYWNNINYHHNRGVLDVILSRSDQLFIYTLDKRTLKLTNIRDLRTTHTGEGVYFSKHHFDRVFIPERNGLVSLNIDNFHLRTHWHSQYNLWQIHSSHNELVHSASLRDSNDNTVAWGVFNEQTGVERTFELKGDPDECQIDKSSNYLLIKEKEEINGKTNEYIRIIDLRSGAETYIANEAGAVGHSDNGFECVFGENDMSSYGGALDKIDFATMEQKLIFSTGIWNMGYFSFANYDPSKGLISTPNELISVKLDGSGAHQVICPNLTQSQEYKHRVKANLCPMGEYAAWTAFVDGKINAYIIKVPRW